MILFDTNVLLDIATNDPVWLSWSENEFRAAAQGPVLVNPIIYAELAPAFATAAELDRWLDPVVFQRLPLPYAARSFKRAYSSTAPKSLGTGIDERPLSLALSPLVPRGARETGAGSNRWLIVSLGGGA